MTKRQTRQNIMSWLQFESVVKERHDWWRKQSYFLKLGLNCITLWNDDLPKLVRASDGAYFFSNKNQKNKMISILKRKSLSHQETSWSVIDKEDRIETEEETIAHQPFSSGKVQVQSSSPRIMPTSSICAATRFHSGINMGTLGEKRRNIGWKT